MEILQIGLSTASSFDSFSPTMTRHPRHSSEFHPLRSQNLSQLSLESKSSSTGLPPDGYIERDVKFAGVIRDIPLTIDPTNRTDILRTIDRGKRELCIASVLGPEHKMTFRLNIHDVKLIRKDATQELLVRVPLHLVAALSYIRDDDTHILAMKYCEMEFPPNMAIDDSQTYHLAILYCDSRGTAEDLCSTVESCFQAIYTDATMRFFDSTVMEGAQAANLDYSASSVSGRSEASSPRIRQSLAGDQPHLAFRSLSSSSLGTNSTLSSVSVSRSTLPTHVRKTSNHGNEGELSNSAEQLILDYMRKLYTKLNQDELGMFATLVKQWHTNLSFTQFCDRVLELYGPERKHLFAEMRPFIPGKDAAIFENYLELNGLAGAGTPVDGRSAADNVHAIDREFGTPRHSSRRLSDDDNDDADDEDGYDLPRETVEELSSHHSISMPR